MRLLLLGCANEWDGNPAPTALAAGQRVSAQFAATAGYALGTLYVEDDPGIPHSALAGLVDAAQHQNVVAVAVSTAFDFGRTRDQQQIMRERITEACGVVVFVIGEFTGANFNAQQSGPGRVAGSMSRGRRSAGFRVVVRRPRRCPA